MTYPSYAVFETDSYDSRIYAYENDVLYGYSIPALYYKATRFYINLHRKLGRNADCWLKYGVSSYRDRDELGTGYEAIDGNKRSEIKAQLRVVF